MAIAAAVWCELCGLFFSHEGSKGHQEHEGDGTGAASASGFGRKAVATGGGELAVVGRVNGEIFGVWIVDRWGGDYDNSRFATQFEQFWQGKRWLALSRFGRTPKLARRGRASTASANVAAPTEP